MPTLQAIEEFLVRVCEEDPSGYRIEMSHKEKQKWIMQNANFVRTNLNKMRGFGRKTWSNFLWSFGLEETIQLSRIKKD